MHGDDSSLREPMISNQDGNDIPMSVKPPSDESFQTENPVITNVDQTDLRNADQISKRPSVRRLQEGILAAQYGADGKGGLDPSDEAKQTSSIVTYFDAFMWVFWIGLTIPLFRVLAINRNHYATDHVHRFSIVYNLTINDITLIRTLYLFISTSLTGHASELLFLYSVRLGVSAALWPSSSRLRLLTHSLTRPLCLPPFRSGEGHHDPQAPVQVRPAALPVPGLHRLLLAERDGPAPAGARPLEVWLPRERVVHHPGLPRAQERPDRGLLPPLRRGRRLRAPHLHGLVLLRSKFIGNKNATSFLSWMAISDYFDCATFGQCG